MSIRPLLLVTAGLFVLGLVPAGAAAEVEHGFVNCTYRSPDGKEESRYVLFVPHDYKGDKPYPLIVFLHGSGEGGTDGRRPVNVGIGAAIRKQEKMFPFLVLFPQAHRGSWEIDSGDDRRTMAILEEVQKTHKVDAKRIYLTGLSSGGDGTWKFAVKYPKVWAAIVPICGVGNPAEAEKIKDIPSWSFQGDRDNPRDVRTAREMVEALKAAGGNPKYTEYPGMNHYIWVKTYDNPEVYDWLLKQRRK